MAKRKYDVILSKRDPNIMNVEIYCAAFVEEDTH